MYYVVAGTVNGKRGAAIVEIEDSGDGFTNDMAALAYLPIDCHRIRRGKNVPECWPLESAEGTRLATSAGLLTPTAVLA